MALETPVSRHPVSSIFHWPVPFLSPHSIRTQSPWLFTAKPPWPGFLFRPLSPGVHSTHAPVAASGGLVLTSAPLSHLPLHPQLSRAFPRCIQPCDFSASQLLIHQWEQSRETLRKVTGRDCYSASSEEGFVGIGPAPPGWGEVCLTLWCAPPKMYQKPVWLSAQMPRTKWAWSLRQNCALPQETLSSRTQEFWLAGLCCFSCED